MTTRDQSCHVPHNKILFEKKREFSVIANFFLKDTGTVSIRLVNLMDLQQVSLRFLSTRLIQELQFIGTHQHGKEIFILKTFLKYKGRSHWQSQHTIENTVHKTIDHADVCRFAMLEVRCRWMKTGCYANAEEFDQANNVYLSFGYHDELKWDELIWLM